MLSVALTGNVAAGKSTVVSHFARWGATVIDADALVRELQAPGSPVLDAIVQRFGREILASDGSLDRARLRRTVMSDETARMALNAIVHPAVAERRAARVQEANRAGDCIVVNDIPLLFEAADPDAFDLVVVVGAPPQMRRERLMRTRGLTADEADRLMRSQWDPKRKLERADFVIENAGSRPDLEQRTRQVWEAIRQRGAAVEVSSGRVLAVLAHPDDESYGLGGTLARYAEAGVEVHLATATAGEATTGSTLGDPGAVARSRVEDLRRAARVLGIVEPRVLSFPDGRLDPEDATGTGAVGQLLDELRPDVVLTFGLDGVTGHADHIAVHHWTTRAVATSRVSPALFRIALPDPLTDRLPVRLRGCPEREITVQIDVRPWADDKRRAIRAHTTVPTHFNPDDAAFRAMFEREWYSNDASPPRRFTGLFEARNRA